MRTFNHETRFFYWHLPGRWSLQSKMDWSETKVYTLRKSGVHWPISTANVSCGWINGVFQRQFSYRGFHRLQVLQGYRRPRLITRAAVYYWDPTFILYATSWSTLHERSAWPESSLGEGVDFWPMIIANIPSIVSSTESHMNLKQFKVFHFKGFPRIRWGQFQRLGQSYHAGLSPYICLILDKHLLMNLQTIWEWVSNDSYLGHKRSRRGPWQSVYCIL
jgi:hypothetical protein